MHRTPPEVGEIKMIHAILRWRSYQSSKMALEAAARARVVQRVLGRKAAAKSKILERHKIRRGWSCILYYLS